MKRRSFLQQTSAAAAYVSLGSLPLISCTHKRKHITILHTNDTHSQIEPFELNHYRYANKGGVARRANIIEQIRKENINTLLLDAGDIFQGTPYFNYFKGEIEFKLMSKLNYDVATLGNHDFDNGIDGFNQQLQHANFDFVSANYDFRNTVLDEKVKPFKVIVKDGIRIGIFGLGIELEGLVNKSLYKETKYLDPIEIATDMSRELKYNNNCDLVICLSHLGYYYKNNRELISDLNLAKKTSDIDLIIGGHTHTFLPKPTVIRNKDGQNVLVNQVGAYGINVGRIDFFFDSDKNKSSSGTTILV